MAGDDVQRGDLRGDDACLPDCGGLECGTDGCGGSCGEYDNGTECDQGACLQPPCARGEPCDDGDLCTKDDACVDGVCSGTAYACDDGKECTADSCDGEGDCDSKVKPGSCLINGLSYAEGETDPYNPCVECDHCSEGFCAAGKECGDDGCGGSCGSCAWGEECTSDGTQAGHVLACCPDGSEPPPVSQLY